MGDKFGNTMQKRFALTISLHTILLLFLKVVRSRYLETLQWELQWDELRENGNTSYYHTYLVGNEAWKVSAVWMWACLVTPPPFSGPAYFLASHSEHSWTCKCVQRTIDYIILCTNERRESKHEASCKLISLRCAICKTGYMCINLYEPESTFELVLVLIQYGIWDL